jgi:hypothetical protein
MKRLEQFIDDNLERFSNLDDSEIYELDAHYMDDDIVSYLKDAEENRFDYKGICVYYVGESDEVWVENMNA